MGAIKMHTHRLVQGVGSWRGSPGVSVACTRGGKARGWRAIWLASVLSLLTRSKLNEQGLPYASPRPFTHTAAPLLESPSPPFARWILLGAKLPCSRLAAAWLPQDPRLGCCSSGLFVLLPLTCLPTHPRAPHNNTVSHITMKVAAVFLALCATTQAFGTC